jgi:alpha-galactosidase
MAPLTFKTIDLYNDAVHITLAIDAKQRVCVQEIYPANATPKERTTKWYDESMLPLASVRLGAEGNAAFKSSKNLVGSALAERLKFRSYAEREGKDANTGKGVKYLYVEQHDESTGLSVVSHLSIFDGIPVVRSSTTARNDGKEPLVISQIASLVVADMLREPEWWDKYILLTATNSWTREAQWIEHSLPSVGVDNYGVHETMPEHVCSLGSYSVTNKGTFSTQGHLPMGQLNAKDGKETWLWQIEHNGSWRWEIADYKDSVYLAASGPEEMDHAWQEHLAPGASFTSPSAALAHVFGGQDEAFAALTEYRRRIIRPHKDHEGMAIIFNDYMNCLMGDPTYEKVFALIEPVAKCGAEYFVIDAGWYADDSSWWDEVGEWAPSAKRFPMGFGTLIEKIRERGLKPGIWVEPEVIGVRSVMAERLPEEAFWRRGGQRVKEKDRYMLDYRHPLVIKHMDGVIDGLIQSLGVTYFKFDYNIDVSTGTDSDAFSPGAGMLGHNRAYLSWIEALMDRHPGLVIENCSSGAQRMEYASLASHPLQSTSDQMDPIRYAAIAAGIHTAVLPEQGATWAYPQPGWSDEKNALTVVNSLLGRVHLSGRLDLLTDKQLDLVARGMQVYESIKFDVKNAVPFWPLGLPAWHDDWLAQGLASKSGRLLLAVWRRGGKGEARLPILALKGKVEIDIKLLYPDFEAEVSWDAEAGELRVALPTGDVAARLFALRAA